MNALLRSVNFRLWLRKSSLPARFSDERLIEWDRSNRLSVGAESCFARPRLLPMIKLLSCWSRTYFKSPVCSGFTSDFSGDSSFGLTMSEFERCRFSACLTKSWMFLKPGLLLYLANAIVPKTRGLGLKGFGMLTRERGANRETGAGDTSALSLRGLMRMWFLCSLSSAH